MLLNTLAVPLWYTMQFSPATPSDNTSYISPFSSLHFKLGISLEKYKNIIRLPKLPFY
jgi:hypothetical protein